MAYRYTALCEDSFKQPKGMDFRLANRKNQSIRAVCRQQLVCLNSSSTAVTHSASPESKLDRIEVSHGTPDFSNQALLCHIDIAQIQGMVDGLHLAYFDEPHTDIFSGRLQNPLAMILCLVQHLSQRSRIKMRRNHWPKLATYRSVQ